jgi:hypothetical protein
MPQATFYAPNVPLLSAAIAVCCASDSDPELGLFWSNPRQFCVQFGLNAEQTGAMIAPENNTQLDKTGKPIPNAAQVEDIGELLIMELRRATPLSTPLPGTKQLDPQKAAQYPVMVRLYQYYALKQGERGDAWGLEMFKELHGEPPVW